MTSLDECHHCPYCDRRFATAALRDIHAGKEHPTRLDEREREAYEAAREAETATIRRFRLKALAALVLLYFGFLFAYSIVG